MRQKSRLAIGILPRLRHRGAEIQVLHQFHLEMRPRQPIANHIRRIRPAGKLLPAPGGVPIFAQLIPPLPLPALTLVTAVNRFFRR